MRVLTFVGLIVVFALQLGTAAPRAADCDAVGRVQFICGQSGPEDLVAIPGVGVGACLEAIPPTTGASG